MPECEHEWEWICNGCYEDGCWYEIWCTKCYEKPKEEKWWDVYEALNP